MKKVLLALIATLMLVMICVSANADLSAPKFSSVKDNGTIEYTDYLKKDFTIKWGKVKGAQSYTVWAIVLNGEPNRGSSGEAGTRIDDGGITVKSPSASFELDSWMVDHWLKIAVRAVGTDSNSPTTSIYLKITSKEPSITIANLKDGGTYTQGKSITLDISGKRYHHFFYRLTCNGSTVVQDTAYSKIKEKVTLEQAGDYTLYVVATTSKSTQTSGDSSANGKRIEKTINFTVKSSGKEEQITPDPQPDPVVLPVFLNIDQPLNGQTSYVGDAIPLKISGSNYDHFFYSVTCNGTVIQQATAYSNVSTVIYLDDPGDYQVYAVATNSATVQTEGDSSGNGSRVEKYVNFTAVERQPAPVITDAPAPVVTETPAPVVTETPAPVVTDAQISATPPTLNIEQPIAGETYFVGNYLPLQVKGSNYHHFFVSVTRDGNVVQNFTQYENLTTQIYLDAAGTYQVYAVATTSDQTVTSGDASTNGLRTEKTIVFNVVDSAQPTPTEFIPEPQPTEFVPEPQPTEFIPEPTPTEEAINPTDVPEQDLPLEPTAIPATAEPVPDQTPVLAPDPTEAGTVEPVETSVPTAAPTEVPVQTTVPTEVPVQTPVPTNTPMPVSLNIGSPTEWAAYAVGADVPVSINGQFDHARMVVRKDGNYVDEVTIFGNYQDAVSFSQNGNYTITVTATNLSTDMLESDNPGQAERRTATVNFRIEGNAQVTEAPAKPKPTISISSPKQGAGYEQGEYLQIQITGSNYDHFFAELTCDGNRINSWTEHNDLTVSVELSQVGSYMLSVVATDAPTVQTNGDSTGNGNRVSEAVAFTVKAKQSKNTATVNGYAPILDGDIEFMSHSYGSLGAGKVSSKDNRTYYTCHDIRRDPWTPVYAPMKGTIDCYQVYDRNNVYMVSYGNYIVFTSEDRLTKMVFGHLNGFEFVAAPSRESRDLASTDPGVSARTDELLLNYAVDAGTCIGYTGGSGRGVTTPHLHVEVYERSSVSEKFTRLVPCEYFLAGKKTVMSDHAEHVKSSGPIINIYTGNEAEKEVQVEPKSVSGTVQFANVDIRDYRVGETFKYQLTGDSRDYTLKYEFVREDGSKMTVPFPNMLQLPTPVLSQKLTEPGTIIITVTANDTQDPTPNILAIRVYGEDELPVEEASSSGPAFHVEFEYSHYTIAYGDTWIPRGRISVAGGSGKLGTVTINSQDLDGSSLSANFTDWQISETTFQQWGEFRIDTKTAPWNVPGDYRIRVWAKDNQGNGGNGPIAEMTITIDTPRPETNHNYAGCEYDLKLRNVLSSAEYQRATTAEKMVLVARSQVGYQHDGYDDKQDKYVLDGKGNAKRRTAYKYTEYGRFVGANDDWCASFIAWCAAQVGVPEDVIPFTAGAGDYRFKDGFYFLWDDTYSKLQDVVPEVGDILALTSYSGGKYVNSKELTSHVAIIYDVSQDADGVYRVKVVEGNWNASVYEKSEYRLDHVAEGGAKMLQGIYKPDYD